MVNILSFWSLEDWNWLFEWGSIFLIAGTVFTGAAALVTGREINKRQELKIIELRAKLLPRRLTGDQKSQLTKLLSGVLGGVVIVSKMADGESADFADDFDSSIRAAQWETLRVVNHITREYGVFIGTFKGTAAGDIASSNVKRLGDALTSIGVPYREKTFDEKDEGSTSPHFQAGYLYLVVTSKPPVEPEQ
jgi:hypothetical protein